MYSSFLSLKKICIQVLNTNQGLKTSQDLKFWGYSELKCLVKISDITENLLSFFLTMAKLTYLFPCRQYISPIGFLRRQLVNEIKFTSKKWKLWIPY